MAVIEGDPEKALGYARELLNTGFDVKQIVTDVLAPAMRVVGEMYERGEYFIADLIASAEAFKQVFDNVLKPRLSSSAASKGVVAVFGTVRGDIHELGKNIATSGSSNLTPTLLSRSRALLCISSASPLLKVVKEGLGITQHLVTP